MYYTVYQVTNIDDGKVYIGKHQTTDINDGYMGSGKLLKRAQKKHGIKAFQKNILFVFDNEEDMNAKEAELVDEAFCERQDTYNLCVGGQGGFSFINNNQLYDRQIRSECGKSNMRRLRETTDVFSTENLSRRAKQAWTQDRERHLKPRSGKDNHRSLTVIDEYGMEYPSIRSLSEARGIHKDTVRTRIRQGIFSTKQT